MNKIAEIMRAVAAALGRLVSRVVQTTKWVGGRAVRVAETVVERIFDAAVAAPRVALDLTVATSKLGIGTVNDVVKLPFRLAGAVLRARQPQQQSPQDAAADEAAAQRAAQQEESHRQAAADRQAEARELVQAIRSVATARARGERPDDVGLALLPDGMQDYMMAMDREEAATVAATSVPGLRGLLRGRPPEGVRSPREVQEAAEAKVVPVEQVAARREAVRSAARAAMRGERPKQVADADAIMSRYG